MPSVFRNAISFWHMQHTHTETQIHTAMDANAARSRRSCICNDYSSNHYLIVHNSSSTYGSLSLSLSPCTCVQNGTYLAVCAAFESIRTHEFTLQPTTSIQLIASLARLRKCARIVSLCLSANCAQSNTFLPSSLRQSSSYRFRN